VQGPDGRRAASSPAPPYASRIDGFGGGTVWSEFSPMAAQCGAVNMGQGFPNFHTPDFVKRHGQAAIEENHNQYARSQGHLPLVQALAEKYTAELQRPRPINAETEVVVSMGATGVLFCLMQALVSPGDEVVVFEPQFDIYAAQAQMAGAKTVAVPLRLEGSGAGRRYTVDMEEFAAALSERTRLVLVNTPHNPTGMQFTAAQLRRMDEALAAFPRAVVVSDEVYEHQLFDGRPRVSPAAVSEDMWRRTVTVSSAGKAFSCTGWKVGWAVGPPELVRAAWMAMQWISFSVATPLQQGVADALCEAALPMRCPETGVEHPSYYAWLAQYFQRKRDRLVQVLEAAGLPCIVPDGGYFVMADSSRLDVPASYLAEPYLGSEEPVTRDWAVARWLTREVGVSPIPPSAFHCKANKPLAANFLRFAFCKTDADIEECGARLARHLG